MPNTAFLPSEWLDERKYVKTDPETLRLESPNVSNVYALGTVTSFTNGSFLDAVDTVRPLAESIRLDQVAATMPIPTKIEDNEFALWWSWLCPSSSDPMKRRITYKQNLSESQFVPCGRGGGVGVLFGWRVPSWMVYKIKARTFMIEKARPIVEGAGFRRA